MLEREFFTRDPVVCARELIGCSLRWGRCEGIIVETEAYSESGDEACHTFVRPSTRAFVGRHPAGTAYVYLNYGVHWLANVLVKGEATGFVLLRALEPVAGVAAMRRRRGISELRLLCSGPGKLTRALGITGEFHGYDLCRSESHAFHPAAGRQFAVAAGVRIGISRAQDLPWRFVAEGSRHVSRPAGRGKRSQLRQ